MNRKYNYLKKRPITAMPDNPFHLTVVTLPQPGEQLQVTHRRGVSDREGPMGHEAMDWVFLTAHSFESSHTRKNKSVY